MLDKEELRSYIEDIRIIDTHEHVGAPNIREGTGMSVVDFILGLYVRDDMWSAGLDDRVWDVEKEEEHRWSESQSTIG